MLPHNQYSFMNWEVSNKIRTRKRSRNTFLKKQREENRKLYTKQRDHCAWLLGKTKVEFYDNINEKDVKTVKPFFSNKTVN